MYEENNFIKKDKDMIRCIKFYADWCGPCRVMTPIFEKVSQNPKFNSIKFEELDIESIDNAKLVTDLKIRNIPTMVLLHEDQVVAKQVGAVNEEIMTKWIENGLELCQDML